MGAALKTTSPRDGTNNLNHLTTPDARGSRVEVVVMRDEQHAGRVGLPHTRDVSEVIRHLLNNEQPLRTGYPA